VVNLLGENTSSKTIPEDEVIASVRLGEGDVLSPDSPQKGGESSFSVALICTASRRIPASATNQGPEKGDLCLV